MPAGDGTGPAGAGPMTGRALGYCAGNNRPGFANPVGGWFYGRGRGGGRGRGYRHWYYATGTPGWMRAQWGPWGSPYYAPAPPAGQYNAMAGMSREDEVNMLRDQADYFKSALDDIQKRLDELEKSGE